MAKPRQLVTARGTFVNLAHLSPARQPNLLDNPAPFPTATKRCNGAMRWKRIIVRRGWCGARSVAAACSVGPSGRRWPAARKQQTPPCQRGCGKRRWPRPKTTGLGPEPTEVRNQDPIVPAPATLHSPLHPGALATRQATCALSLCQANYGRKCSFCSLAAGSPTCNDIWDARQRCRTLRPQTGLWPGRVRL